MRNRKTTVYWLALTLNLLIVNNLFAYTNKDLLQKTATLEWVKESLFINHEWVTYPGYTDREGWDQLLGENKSKCIAEAEQYLSYKWQVVKATDYLEFERSGDRNVMQQPHISNYKAIAYLMMGELSEGKGRFMDQLVNGVFHMCEMTSWVISAHMIRQSSGRALPDHRRQIIDLTSGNIGSQLAWVYYFFHERFDAIDPVISIRLYQELNDRILEPFLDQANDQTAAFWWLAIPAKPDRMINNWNPWCNCNVLQCFMLLDNNRERVAKAVYKTMLSMDQFINYTHTDGACEEGPSYWSHAAGKMYDYLQLLSDATGGRISIFDQPVIRNMGEYIVRSYAGKGWVVNFADASAKWAGDARFIYRFGKAVKSNEMMSFSAYLEQQFPRPMPEITQDVFRTLEGLKTEKEFRTVKPEFKQSPCAWYPETQFCYLSNRTGFFLAAKGGYNSESHNHNDIGTFNLYLNQVPVFIDAGVGTYTRQTFSSERYAIWTMQSNYHNLPLINGQPQSFGRNYKASDAAVDPGKLIFSANIATAYPAEAGVKNWIRSYKLHQTKVVITDKFELNETKQQNQIRFLTWGKIDTSLPGKVTIAVEDQKVVFTYDPKTFNLKMETITLDDPPLIKVWGQQIYCFSLEAKNLETKGSYTYTITKQ